LKNIQDGALAPDWFKGHKSGEINFKIGVSEDELTEMQFEDLNMDIEIDINQFQEFKGFEDNAGDLMFPIFVDSMVQEFVKIDEDSTKALHDIR